VAGGRVCRTELQLRQRNLRRIDLDWRKIIFNAERAPISKAGTTVNFHCGELAMFATLRQSSGWAKRRVFIMAEDNKIHHLGWFLAGLGVGAVVGILYAPKSGRETRENLANSAREGTEYVRTKAQQTAEQVGALVDKGKEQVGSFVDKSKETVSTLVDKSKDQVVEYVDRSREVVDRGRAQWEEFVERGKSLVADQSTRVSAAVEAGRNAYRTTTVDPTSL
jgi:gas vesicle protein